MISSRGMASLRWTLLQVAALNIVTSCLAGPLGPLPNVTSAELGFKEGSCSLGDVVYMPGDEFPGSTPCERCKCSESGVECARQQCESRPGCKALHRPDHCCPTYQCECEQEGRVYGNGEKLVDPADPCRVCYCQGGEVVCRRIACFVRDDCTPRLVPGRCCPEYDNCPLRGVTSLPGMSSSISSVSINENESPPAPPKENIEHQKITIKEITPVSEIPFITEVKIKEILPSPSIDVAEYASSKSPLIPREATSEKNFREFDTKTEAPTVIEVHSLSSVVLSSPKATNPAVIEIKETDATPSKISLSTQDSINSNIYPSVVPFVATMGVPPITEEPLPMATTKAAIIEEEDTFDHNPAFPPLPDDLAVLRNHEDEIVPEVVVDNEHVSSHDIIVASVSPSTEAEIKELLTTTPKDLPDTTTVSTTEKLPKTPEVTTIAKDDDVVSTATPNKESQMLNLRSAIPTEILNSPSLAPEDITGELDEISTVADDSSSIVPSTTAETHAKFEDITTKNSVITTEEKIASEVSAEITSNIPEIDTTLKMIESELESSSKEIEQATSSITKSDIATEVTSQTELSSLPIETSDQNPPEVIIKEINMPSTVDIVTSNTKTSPASSEVITLGKSSAEDTTEFGNVETTEFILTSFGSAESATEAELIKISGDLEKSAAIIESPGNKKNNVLTDLINLVSDVASISDHTTHSDNVHRITTIAPSFSDSEELIPVNAGYKSKNKHSNQNSIAVTEMATKLKQSVKQKIVEIEDDDSETVTDSPPPNDKVEPTTRRPIIDNVSAGNMPENKTEKKDIEIITQSYVPTINRRPTKVIMQSPTLEEAPVEDSPVTGSAETATESNVSNESAQATTADGSSPSEVEATRTDAAHATQTTTQ